MPVDLLRWLRRPDIHNGYPVFIAPSKIHGSGVFAATGIRKGEWIEVAPLLPVPASERDLLRGTSLHYSYFMTGDEGIPAVIGLGFAGLYNHACPAAASYEIRLKEKTIRFRAVRDIREGEEITINYHGEPGNPAPVQFNEQP